MDVAQVVVQSLGRTINFCFLYLGVVVGITLLFVGILKLIAWVSDTRRAREWDEIPPSSNGRTFDFESKDVGSNPTRGTV